MTDPTRLGVVETAQRVAAREVTAVDVVEAALARIAERDAGLNAFSVVLADSARARAADIDSSLEAGVPVGPLAGVPVAVKEEIAVAGSVSTFGGHGNTTPAREDSELVRRLRAAGAIIIGRTVMPEFGAFPFTESARYGHTHNPWDPTRSPGGSSGGSAVAVASGMVPAAFGGDGGGSLRVPAACCGVFALKPQRGRISNAPFRNLWWALGTAGPLTRTVADSAALYDAVKGNVRTDAYRAGEVGSFVEAAAAPPGRLRIGWSLRPALPFMRLDPANARAVRETAALLADLGHEVREVDPHLPDPTFAFAPQFLASISAEADSVEHFERLERRTRELYRLGAWVTPGVLDAAIRKGEEVSRRANQVFEEVDVLLTPVMVKRPVRIGHLDGVGAVRAMLRSLPSVACTGLWNVAGNPAASVPRGVAADGLPLAVQLVGPTDGEERLLSLAAQIETAAPFPAPPPS